MGKLLKYLKGYRAAAITGPFFKLLEALFELIVPLVVASIIDVGIAGGDKDYILKMGLVMLALSVSGFLFSSTCQYLAARASLGYGTNLRKAAFGHIYKLPLSSLDKFSPATLVNRVNTDVNQTQHAVAMFIRLVTRVPFIVIGAVIMAFTIHARLALIFLAAAAVVGVVLYIIMKRTVPLYRSVQAGLDTVTGMSAESLSGARVIRAFSREKQTEDNFRGAADGLAKKQTLTGFVSSLINPLSYFIVNAAVIALIWAGAFTVEAGGLTQGQLIALVNYLTQITLAIIVFANIMVTFTRASASASRINELLDTPVEEKETGAESAAKGVDKTPPEIVFDNVSFSYDGAASPVLKNISFSVKAGQSLGIIGGTGSGKSTLMSLVMGFYRPDEGNISAGGYDYDGQGYPIENIAYVPQRATLVKGTLRENLCWGDGAATDDELISALKASQAYEFTSTLKDGLDANVEAFGRNFSGGQRQRLVIARALVKKAPLLIIDDGASALDYLTYSRLNKNLKSIPSTKLIVSQKVSAVASCDTIIVLEDGEIKGTGTHRRLLSTCAEYKEIYDAQTGADI